jgi:spermidine synthase
MGKQLSLRREILGAVFLCSLAVLLFEMAQIRTFSYSLPAILSYIGISLAMTGFGIGAMLLSLMPSLSATQPHRNLSLLAILQAISMLASSAIFARVSWDCILDINKGLLPLILKILLPCTLPYLFGGLFLAIVFSSTTRNIGKVYFYNLIGSGVGAVLITLLLAPLGAEKVIGTAAVLSAVSALLLAIPAHRIMAGGAAALIIGLVALFPYLDSFFPFKPRPTDATGYYMLKASQNKGTGGKITREFSKWDIVARIDVWKQEGEPLTVPEKTDYRLLTVDSGAATVLIGDPGKAGWGKELFEETFYGLAYLPKPNPVDVLIIGTGGGADVQTALHWGAGNVTAVEINSTTISAVKGQYASFLMWPLSDRVSIVHEDGRSFVKHTMERFDVIQLTGVDTLTVNATGALNMVEEYLYTVEAFEDYIRVLKPNGVLAIVRFLSTDIRLAAIATEALFRLGITDPQDHIVAFRQGITAAILVSKSKFTKAQLDTISTIADRTVPNNVFIPPYEAFDFHLNWPISLVYVPGRIDSASYKSYFDTVNSGPAGRKKEFKQNIVPTDNKPFFMFMGFLSGRMDIPKMKSNFQLFKGFWFSTVLFALVCIIFPVLVFRRNITSYISLIWVLPYFALIGVCFMMLEIGIINWFCIFMGSPGASMAVVLTSLLVASGIGSYISEFPEWQPATKIAAATAILVISSLALKLLSPLIFDSCWKAGIGQGLRGLVAGGMITPMGFAMGWFFPAGLKTVDIYLPDHHLVPWAISINGFTSVVGSIAALPITIYFGFNYLFLLSLVGYVIAGVLSLAFFSKKHV